MKADNKCTWVDTAKEKGEPLIINIKMLARYRKYLANARKNNGNVQYWQTRINNLLAKNP
tara:strand:+ start:285 stop:464 length:180 start_codon:yes stop_codon:yes gene_type:complete